MNLALLLLGPGTLARGRLALAAAGLLLLAAGAGIAIQPRDAVTLDALEAIGWILVAMGLGRSALALVASGGVPSLVAVPGVVLVALGMGIAENPSSSGDAAPWLLGVALLLNGLYQTGSAVVIRYPGWGWLLATGLGSLLLGAGLFVGWKQVAPFLVPAALGAGLGALGLAMLRTSALLGRYLRASDAGTAQAALRWFLDVHVPRRFHRRYLMPDCTKDAREREPRAAASAPAAARERPPRAGERPARDLLVHVWTPTTVARVEGGGLDPVRRYVAARDASGKYAVGHAALELDPDVYISHCDGDPTAFDSQEQVWDTLRSRDVPGVFLPSFEEEVASYMTPTATVRFQRFDDAQLRAFWALYRAVPLYNFTNRNCSVAVAMALEAALLGSLGGARRVRDLLGLLTDKDVWIAHFIRLKAREMVWTPGMMLDYALALQRVVEAHG